MKRHWLRGLLLGVSLALLLAGGVAVAAGLFIRPDQDCFECYYGTGEVPDDFRVDLAAGGWNMAGPDVALKLTEPTAELKLWLDPSKVEECEAAVYATCSDQGPWWVYLSFGNCPSAPATSPASSGSSMTPPYGEFVAELSQDGAPAQTTFVFAEDCPEEAEFVPEPGSILLLGSGVMGLAGYAGLRLRART